MRAALTTTLEGVDTSDMTVPSLSSVNVADSVGIAVASKQLDAARAEGEAINSLIDDAASVAQAGRGAISAASGAAEPGGRVDVTA
ncbi:MAG: hypothetical protein HRU13_01965 [Phycisphaerales bacterium]|nr:hypothetical protein [Phycisphaerales bacterium]